MNTKDPTRDPASEARDDHDVDESEESFRRFTEAQLDHADRLHDEQRDRRWEEACHCTNPGSHYKPGASGKFCTVCGKDIVRENSSPAQLPSTTSILPSKSL